MPVVSHLLFANGSLVFLEAKPQCCANFLQVAEAFSEASGLAINATKSSLFFSANASAELKGEIMGVLGMQEMEVTSQYLRLPVFWGK